MNFGRNLIIMQPFNLPWKFVSPADYKSLDYHLTNDLTIRFEKVYNTTIKVDEVGAPKESPDEMELLVGQEIFLSYETGHFSDITSLNAERVFKNEILTMKSQERINKCFADKSGEVSCFFTDSQMEHFQNLFESYYFICHEVSVRYKGSLVDDITNLPQKEFKIAANAFAELNVIQATVDYSQSKDELNEAYHHYLEKNVAKVEKEKKSGIWNAFADKKERKETGKVVGSIAIGAALWGIKRKLLASKSWIGIAAGAILSVIGFGFELFGKQRAEAIVYRQAF